METNRARANSKMGDSHLKMCTEELLQMLCWGPELNETGRGRGPLPSVNHLHPSFR